MDGDVKTIIKEYKINESVLVTYHMLNSLYQQFFTIYPKKIGDQIVTLIDDLRDGLMLEQEKDCKGFDINNSFYEKVVYIKHSEINKNE